MPSISSGVILILLLSLFFLGMIFFIAWKTDKMPLAPLASASAARGSDLFPGL